MNKNQIVYYSIGGLTVCMDAPAYEDAPTLAPFRTAPCAPDEICRVRVVPAPCGPSGKPTFFDTDKQRAYYRECGTLTRVFHDDDGCTVLMTDRETDGHHTALLREDCLKSFGSAIAVKIMDLPRTFIRLGGVFLHASFIDVGGEAILFTAQKQVGKSTQAALWQQYRGAEIINGDRALIRRLNGVFCACGSPYCGTSGICRNRILPLKAVVILSRGQENRASRASVRQALASLLDGCTYDVWDADVMDRVTDLCSSIITEVPFYTLSCTPDEGAVRALEEVLSHE